MQKKPFYLLTLPGFFVLHGFTLNYHAVPAGEALLLAVIYVAIAIAMAAIASWVFGNRTKGAIFALVVLSVQFFYGSVQDMLQQYFPGSFLVRYRFIFSFLIIFFGALAIWLKKRKKPLQQFTLYLNSLLLVLLLIDMGSLLVKSFEKKETAKTLYPGLTICDTCFKPDIYFILPDQYTGNTALQGIFNFDNSAFLNALKSRGFLVANNSSSNYNLTPFSVASTLNMEYIPLKKGNQDFGSVGKSYNLIRQNHVLNYLTASGYEFYNCSIFDFDGQPANEYGAFLPYGIKLITSQTFTKRLERDFHPDILAGKFGQSLQKKYAYEYRHFNDDILTLTQNIVHRASTKPKFVYTHLMMPHYPYYFDSSGKPLPLEKLAGLRKADPKDYAGYLQYTNQKLLALVDHILQKSARPPVIILLGDHGFRHPDMKTDPRFDFMNLNAVFLPERRQAAFYDSITNVNQFRVLLNTLFHQQLPLLKDSTINVWPDTR